MTQANEQIEYGFMRLPDVLGIFGVSKTAFYDGIKEGIFPKPLKLGRCSVWDKKEVRSAYQRIVDRQGTQ